jgi:hypothetical protein
MTVPCTQAAPIAQLSERSENQQKSLREMAGALKINNELLKQVAEVLSDIRHLHEDSRRNEKAITEMFDRVRALEMAPNAIHITKSLAIVVDKLVSRVETMEKEPGRAASKAWWVVFGVLAGAAGSIFSGLIIVLVKWSAGI